MLNKDNALKILSETIQHSLRHEDYNRVKELAEEYHDIFSGSNVNKYLKRLLTRETEQMFEQRCAVYNTTIPSVVEKLEGLFNKPLRSNRIYSSIEHPNVTAYNEIVNAMNSFYQGEYEFGVDAYLRDKWKRLNIFDPNAFICIEFSDFDYTKEKPKPFAIEYSSKQVIRYKSVNGVLEYLIVELDHKYRTSTDKPKDVHAGHKYIMYINDWAIVLTEVHKDKRITDIQNPEFLEIANEQGVVERVFVKQEFNTMSKVVPCFRAGFKLDSVTKDRTCISIIHAALAFFKKELKSGSEFDLTMSLHAFPVRVQWGKSCSGDSRKGILCKDGRTADGSVCPICKGSAQQAIATSTQDIIFVKPPKTKDDPVLDLSKAFTYITPPVEFLKFQGEFVSSLADKAKDAVFPQDTVQKKGLNTTATEMDYSYDNVYDVYHPFTSKYSYSWQFIVKQIAIYLDNLTDQFRVYHQFPKDFKLKSVNVLLAEAKVASESGLSQHAINAINNDVIEAMYADDQNTLTKIKIKDKFHPFSGKSPAELQSILMSGDILPFYKTLYLYFDVIFDEIDNEYGDKFYLMKYPVQREIVKGKVDEIMKDVESSKASMFNVSGINNTDGEQEGQ